MSELEQLRRRLERGSLTDLLLAYLEATLLASGPWLAAALALAALPFLLGFDWRRGSEELLLFLTSLGWIFALAFTFGPAGSLAHARLTSDLLYLERPERILPNLHLLWLRLLLLVQPLWLGYLFLDSTLSWRFILKLGLALALQIGIVLFSGLMATLRRFRTITLLYSLAFLLFLLAVWQSGWQRAEALLELFLLSQLFLLLALLVRSWWSYPFRELFLDDFGAKAYRQLFAIGLLFGLGLWLDKWLFWWSPVGLPIAGALRYSPLYDWPAFMALLSLVPFLGLLFLLHESRFVPAFGDYYRLSREACRLETLWRAQERLIATTRRVFHSAIAFQLLLAPPLLIGGRWLLERFAFPVAFQQLFTNLLPGALLLSDLTWLLLLFLYFDERRAAFQIALLFALLSGAASFWVAHHLPPSFYGLNLTFAVLPPLLLALFHLHRLLGRLTYYTFMQKNCPAFPSGYYELKLDDQKGR